MCPRYLPKSALSRVELEVWGSFAASWSWKPPCGSVLGGVLPRCNPTDEPRGARCHARPGLTLSIMPFSMMGTPDL